MWWKPREQKTASKAEEGALEGSKDNLPGIGEIVELGQGGSDPRNLETIGRL